MSIGFAEAVTVLGALLLGASALSGSTRRTVLSTAVLALVGATAFEHGALRLAALIAFALLVARPVSVLLSLTGWSGMPRRYRTSANRPVASR